MEPSIEIPRPRDRVKEILDKYLNDPRICGQLAVETGRRPEVFTPVHAEAASEISVLNAEKNNELASRFFETIAQTGEEETRKPAIWQDRRIGALGLLKLIDYSKVDRSKLTLSYLQTVRQLSPQAGVMGQIEGLLEAGKIIAPYLLTHGQIGEAMENIWRKTADRFLPGDEASYRQTVNGLAEIQNLLPRSLPMLPQAAVLPSESRETHFPQIVSSFVGRLFKRPAVSKEQPRKETPKEEAKKPRFKETGATSEYAVFQKDLAWLRNPEDKIRVRRVVSETSGHSCYIGTDLGNNALKEAAKKVTGKNSQGVYELFYTDLEKYLQTQSHVGCERVDKPRSSRPVYSKGNPYGLRVYYMEVGKVGKEPVIVVVGYGEKGQQPSILTQLTDDPWRTIKKQGGG